MPEVFIKGCVLPEVVTKMGVVPEVVINVECCARVLFCGKHVHICFGKTRDVPEPVRLLDNNSKDHN